MVRGSFKVGGRTSSTRKPSYPNWQRKRIQNPSSVSSNLTEGTQAVAALAQLDGFSIFARSPHHPLVLTHGGQRRSRIGDVTSPSGRPIVGSVNDGWSS